MQRKLNELSLGELPIEQDQQDQQDQQNFIPPGEFDHEGAMARADLFKLATYSNKLFKKIDSNSQLESWVQAKITKAADYITSVYHYLEYEMPLSDYGKQLDNAEIYSESQKTVIRNKLIEAKEALKIIKIAHADKIAEANYAKSKKDVDLNELTTDTMKSYAKAATQDLTDKATKLARTNSSKKQADLTRKVVNRNKGIETAIDKMEEEYEQDEITGEVSRKKDYSNSADSSKNKGTSVPDSKKKVAKEPQYDKLGLPVAKSSNLDESKQSVNFDEVDLSNLTRIRDLAELKSAAFELISKPSNRPMKPEKVEWFKNVLDQKTNTASVIKMMYDLFLSGEGYGVIGSKGSTKQSSYRNKFDEAKEKPSAGLSKTKKSAVVKKAVAGKDIGKPGKGFEKVAAKATKQYGSKEKGEKVAAAAMWKNIKKESVNEDETRSNLSESEGVSQLDQLLAMQQQYANTKWAKQLAYRVDWLTHQLDQSGGVTTTGQQLNTTAPVLSPEEWNTAHQKEVQMYGLAPSELNESVELGRIKMLSGL